MKILLTLLSSFAIISSVYSQKKEDSKIIITLADTSGIHEKIKKAFARQDFILKEIYDSDTLRTFPRELTNMGGYAIAYAEIKDNQVTLFGFYGLKKVDAFGIPTAGRSYNRILYFKAGKTWPLLQRVAESMGGEITYKK